MTFTALFVVAILADWIIKKHYPNGTAWIWRFLAVASFVFAVRDQDIVQGIIGVACLWFGRPTAQTVPSSPVQPPSSLQG